MFRLVSKQHYQHRTNQKLRSWANAVFQNRGVCGQAFPSFPSSSPVIPFFFCSRPNFSRRTRAETLATQAMYTTSVYHVYLSINWRDTIRFDSEDDYRTGCGNVSHCQRQQSCSGLRSPGRSKSTKPKGNLLVKCPGEVFVIRRQRLEKKHYLVNGFKLV